MRGLLVAGAALLSVAAAAADHDAPATDWSISPAACAQGSKFAVPAGAEYLVLRVNGSELEFGRWPRGWRVDTWRAWAVRTFAPAQYLWSDLTLHAYVDGVPLVSEDHGVTYAEGNNVTAILQQLGPHASWPLTWQAGRSVASFLLDPAGLYSGAGRKVLQAVEDLIPEGTVEQAQAVLNKTVSAPGVKAAVSTVTASFEPGFAALSPYKSQYVGVRINGQALAAAAAAAARRSSSTGTTKAPRIELQCKLNRIAVRFPLALVGSLGLFHLAPTIASSAALYYGTGAMFGAAIAIALVALVLFRNRHNKMALLAGVSAVASYPFYRAYKWLQGTGPAPFASGGAGGAYGGQEESPLDVWGWIDTAFGLQQGTTVLVMLAFVAVCSLAVVAYFYVAGPVTNPRALNLMTWGLQAVALYTLVVQATQSSTVNVALATGVLVHGPFTDIMWWVLDVTAAVLAFFPCTRPLVACMPGCPRWCFLCHRRRRAVPAAAVPAVDAVPARSSPPPAVHASPPASESRSAGRSGGHFSYSLVHTPMGVTPVVRHSAARLEYGFENEADAMQAAARAAAGAVGGAAPAFLPAGFAPYQHPAFMPMASPHPLAVASGYGGGMAMVGGPHAATPAAAPRGAGGGGGGSAAVGATPKSSGWLGNLFSGRKPAAPPPTPASALSGAPVHYAPPQGAAALPQYPAGMGQLPPYAAQGFDPRRHALPVRLGDTDDEVEDGDDDGGQVQDDRHRSSVSGHKRRGTAGRSSGRYGGGGSSRKRRHYDDEDESDDSRSDVSDRSDDDDDSDDRMDRSSSGVRRRRRSGASSRRERERDRRSSHRSSGRRRDDLSESEEEDDEGEDVEGEEEEEDDDESGDEAAM